MARGFDSTAKTESAKGYNSIATLVEVLVDPSNPTYLTDFARDITHDSKTYLSAQGLMGVSGVSEDSSNSIFTVEISLTGVPDDFVKLFLDFDYIDRPLRLRKVFLDSAGAVLGNSRLIFDGRIDKPVIKHEFKRRTATMAVSASSHWVDFEEINGRKTNDSEQQSLFSGDSCFEFAIDFDKEVTWGQAD
tara:strand:- start:526 stop:1095 length:570 start_codon:yes stop_codon:yes gene_type:complete